MSRKMMKRRCVSRSRVSWSWAVSWPKRDKLQVRIALLRGIFHFFFFFFTRCHYFTFLLELGGLLKFVRPFLISISKAKAARLVRSLLDLFLDMEAATGQEVELCLECIEWAKAEKRTFLRQALEVNINDSALALNSQANHTFNIILFTIITWLCLLNILQVQSV